MRPPLPIRWIGFAVVVTCILGLAPPTLASDTGIIFGARVGNTKAHDYEIDDPLEANDITNLDDSGIGWQVFAGYQLIKYFQLEASYLSLGKLEADGPAFGGFTDEIEAKGWNFAGVAIVPLSHRFSLHGKVGAFVWTQDVDYSDIGGDFEYEDTGTGLSAGLGFSASVNHSHTLKLELDGTRFFEVGDLDNSGHQMDRDFFSVGFSYFFDLAGSSIYSE